MKQKTGVFTALAATLLLGTMVGVGCGGDDDTTSTSTGGSGGSGGTTGGSGGKGGAAGSTAGTGGTGGTTDAGGKGGTAGADAGADAVSTIPCGTSMCAPITGVPILGSLPACCPGDTPNACGGAFPGGGCLTATPGTADANCPMLTLMNFPLTGCCRPNGMCGVNLSGIGLGCNDPTSLGGMPGAACGGDAAPPPADTGAPDTGTTDTGTTDTGTTDTGTTDTGTPDTGTTDTGTTDTGTTDTGTTDGRGDSTPPSDAPAG